MKTRWLLLSMLLLTLVGCTSAANPVATPAPPTVVRPPDASDTFFAGRKIATTAEHPFYVLDKGWVPAGQLTVGDQVNSHDGQWTPISAIELTGKPCTVYNFRVADHHTYFVGDDDWGFSVWVHNATRSYSLGSQGVNSLLDSVGAEFEAATTAAELCLRRVARERQGGGIYISITEAQGIGLRSSPMAMRYNRLPMRPCVRILQLGA